VKREILESSPGRSESCVHALGETMGRGAGMAGRAAPNLRLLGT
jgi:hypothetical protein